MKTVMLRNTARFEDVETRSSKSESAHTISVLQQLLKDALQRAQEAEKQAKQKQLQAHKTPSSEQQPQPQLIHTGRTQPKCESAKARREARVERRQKKR